MRIRALTLSAFGPFTDKELVFADAGLSVVYGLNEAGKSSALRGLKALLYGIEVRTPDNFIHDNDKLRIQGSLLNEKAQQIDFIRRKGRKNTLLTVQDNELDEQKLKSFLQDVSADVFSSLFGIDHQALVQGGNEILQQKGALGEALFSAALGSPTLHDLLAELDNSAKNLFLASGSRPKINSAIRNYREISSEIRKISLSSREWKKHQQALDSSTKETEKVQTELATSRTEANRLRRIQRILPKLSRRRELLSQQNSMGRVVVLGNDFSDRRHKAVNELEKAKLIAGKATNRLHGLQQQLAGLSTNNALLEQAQAIEDLHARLGGYRQAQQDRPGLAAHAGQLLSEVESMLKESRPDLDLTNIEQLRPVLAYRKRITDLGSKEAVLLIQNQQAKTDLRDTGKRLQEALKAFDEIFVPGATDALHRALSAARKKGELDTALESTRSELATREAECAAVLARVGLWQGELDEVPKLPLPGRESIQQYTQKFEELTKQSQHLEEKHTKLCNEREVILQRLDEGERVGDVPTEAKLRKSRTERDAVWQLLRLHWVDGMDITEEAGEYISEGSLPEVFENRLASADEVSDRLWREADRVHALASDQARQQSLKKQLEETAEKLRVIQDERNKLSENWKGLWSPCQITPLTPPEMRDWLDAFEKLRDRVEQLFGLRQKNKELEQNRQLHTLKINEQMTALGAAASTSVDLETVLLEGEALANQIDQANTAQKALNKEVRDKQAKIEMLREKQQLAEEALVEWKSQWVDQMRVIGLPESAQPTEVDQFFENVRKLFSKLEEERSLSKRIDTIDADTKDFCTRAKTMVAAVAPDLENLTPDPAVVRLHSLLSEHRSKNTKRQQIEDQIEKENQEIQDSKATIETMDERLLALCVEAECESQNQLDAAERRSEDFHKIGVAIESIEREILEIGDGNTIAELEAEAEGVDPDSLPGRISELKARIEEELEPKRQQLAEDKGRQEKELELMDGSDEAAQLAEDAQTMLVSIRNDAERYVRFKLAGRILRDQIEKYRQENQGPLLKRASEYFKELTLGSFEGLRTDFDHRDEPILAGLRPVGERVRVEGMSSGTRDQLYLALRLASLEKFMESSEPMPFIVDDILVDFDDSRSKAALDTLAELAERTQVILFTHHLRVVEQSKQVKGLVEVLEL